MSPARMQLRFLPIRRSYATKQNICFHCLNKMNKKLGTRIPDCLVGAHEPELSDQKFDYVSVWMYHWCRCPH
jgi:hypothetical protein